MAANTLFLKLFLLCGVTVLVFAELERGMCFSPLKKQAALSELTYPAKLSSIIVADSFACATACLEATFPLRCVSYNLRGSGSPRTCELFWKVTYNPDDMGLVLSPGVTHFVRDPPAYKYLGCKAWTSDAMASTTGIVTLSHNPQDTCATQIWAIDPNKDGFALTVESGMTICRMMLQGSVLSLVETLTPLTSSCEEEGTEGGLYLFV